VDTRFVVCPFDGKPCSRPVSPLDGDLQCGGQWAMVMDENVAGADSVTFVPEFVEVEVMPVCPRFKGERDRKK